MNTATIQVRTAPEIKNASDTIFNKLGITMSDAINIFLRQAILYNGFPFELRLPRYNNTTIKAMQDIENAIKDGVRGTTDFNAVLAELNAVEIC